MHTILGQTPHRAFLRSLFTAALTLGALAFLTLTPTVCAAATTYYVSPSGNDNNPGTQAAPFLTIQAGINNAATGDTVTLEDGTYSGAGDRDLDAGGNSVTVNSVNGAAATIIDCGGTSSANHRAFYFHSNESAAIISGLTLKNSYEGSSTGDGGAIYINSGCTVALSNCTFSNDITTSGYGGTTGGGIGNNGTISMMKNCTFTGNSGNYGDGLYNNGTVSMMTNCTFNSNTGADSALYNDGTISMMTNCIANNNTADGIHNDGTATLLNCTTSDNAYRGVYNSTGIITLTNCTLETNQVRGLFNGYKATLTNCTITNNQATAANGGGVRYASGYGNAFLKMTNCTVTGNTAIWDSNQNYGSGGGVSIESPGATLTNCIISNNTAYTPGGGICNISGPSIITNCVIAGNTTKYSNGGGVYNTSQITLQFCTLYGNSTQATGTQGGALENDGTAILTDDILWGNTAPYASAIGIPSTGNPVTTVTYSDIQGGLSGTGNFHADPLFFNPPTDLSLKNGSPCLGAGIAITGPNGVTTDLDGNTRGNPPTIGAYEDAEAVPGLTGHVLWTNTNGTAALWNYNTATGAFGQFAFGPYSGWSAKAIAYGSSDGKTQLLWNKTDGTAALWNVTATGSFTTSNFGPYSGWTANAVSVNSSSTTHLLWTNTNGTAALWNVSGGQYQGEHDYGPYAGWTAKAVADAPDGTTRMLWTNTNGTAAFWDVTPTTGAFSQHTFGPYSGWSAKAISVSSATTHILWSNTNGTQSVWNYSPATGTFTTENYGPYAGWSANGLADGSDGKTRLLWNNVNGTASFWSLDNTTGVFGAFNFGPYAGWTAVAVSAGP